ncbi:PHB depolymerase family esterase [soil metagenome]
MDRPRARALLPTSLLVLGLLATACGRSSSDAAGPAPTSAPSSTWTSTSTPTTTAPATTSTVGRATDASLATPDGRTRTFHVFVPSSVGTDPVPLLIALHGGTGWGLQFEKNSGFDGLAEANRFIVVYPDGVGVGDAGTDLRTWNGGRCCGPAVKQDVDDVTFVRLLIDRMEAEHRIDPKRVFAAGHSNGGIMAYRLACQLSDRIAAIGVQSSALEVDGCRPTAPVSVLHVHGSADQNLPIEGGIGPNAMSGVSFTRPLTGLTTFAAADACPGAPVVRKDPGNADLTLSEWAPCGGGSTVAFVEVAGASHAWMGHATGGSGKVGAVYEGFDSSLQIWNFLAQHPRA